MANMITSLSTEIPPAAVRPGWLSRVGSVILQEDRAGAGVPNNDPQIKALISA